MRGGGALALLATALAAWALGCGDKPTSISVITTTSLACNAIKDVTFTVTSTGATDGPSKTTTQCQDGQGEARIGTLVLVPGGANDARITVRVVAGVDRPSSECTNVNGYAGCVIARRTLRFVPNRELDLPVALRAECKNMPCDGATTCVKGECRSAKIDDAASCVDAGCDESTLDARPGGVQQVAGDGGTTSDGGTILVLPDGGIVCGTSEKICAGACVSAADPMYGCTHVGCTPCPGMGSGDYACANDACALLKCKPGFKNCGGSCVPTDVAHGCSAAACGACESANGTPSCAPDGHGGTVCAITCSAGYKLCGGKCVNIDDPTYGCSAKDCSNAACPDPGQGGTLVCSGGTCIIGSCPAGTKNCNQRCVPTDANNGCQDTSRCTACGPSYACQGAPTVCTCVPEPASTTCAGKQCGTSINNCGQQVACPDTCQAPNVCGGGGAGPNGCGCNDEPLTVTCSGKQCGYVYNNCGHAVSCGGCTLPQSCGGAGVAFTCGCTPLTACYGYCGCIDDGCGGYCCDYSGCGGGG